MNDSDDLEHKSLDQQKTVLTKEDRDEQKVANELGRGQVKDSAQLSMHLKVHSPFKDYFDDQAFSISAENLTGPFDVLPHHHNFICLLNECELVIRSAREGITEPIKIRISGGLMHVKADEVIVFLDV
jgi:hypothetical protein